MRFIAAILVLLLTAISVGSEAKEARVALVIGNNAYSGGLLPLKNAVNDAILISRSLRQAGFEVDELHDADTARTEAAIARLGERVKSGGAGTVGLFYFAGHGLQSYGANYLVATDAPLGKPDDISRFGIKADNVLRIMASAGAESNILILDACRPNRVSGALRPFAAAGLAEVDARDKDPERGFLIAYSTGLGESAADGADGNSPYARTLADHMLRPGIPLEVLFRNVRKAMVDNGYQKPWESTSMQRGIAFVGEPQEPAAWNPQPLAPGSFVQIGDFGSYPADLGVDLYIPAERYLRQGRVPVRIGEVSPSSSEVVFFGASRLYEGRAVTPTISGNVLTQIGTGNVPAGFTLELPQPASRFRFLIPHLFAATESGITFPAWTATAYAEDGKVVDVAQDELVRSFTDVPEKFFVLEGTEDRGITKVRFESDPRLGGVPFAAFSALLIEGIWIQAK
jgi:hypothetical protein